MNARHPDAPTAEQTAERILQRIARASSKAPARADEVRSDLGLNQATFAAGLDLLRSRRQITTAKIQRAGDDAMWQAIWPTGVRVEHGSWTGNSHSGLFDKDATPRRFPAAPDPTRDPRPDLRTRKPAAPAKEEPMQEAQSLPRPRGKLQAAVIDALAGRTRDQAIAGPDLARQLRIGTENMRHCTRRLVNLGRIGFVQKTVGAWQVGTYYDITTDAVAQAPAAPEPTPAVRQPISEAEIQAFADGLEPEPEPVWAPQAAVLAEEAAIVARDDAAEQAAPAAAPQIDFALWADGRLDIVDGDELIQIPPRDVGRLALLLGVPGAALPQLIGA